MLAWKRQLSYDINIYFLIYHHHSNRQPTTYDEYLLSFTHPSIEIIQPLSCLEHLYTLIGLSSRMRKKSSVARATHSVFLNEFLNLLIQNSKKKCRNNFLIILSREHANFIEGIFSDYIGDPFFFALHAVC